VELSTLVLELVAQTDIGGGVARASLKKSVCPDSRALSLTRIGSDEPEQGNSNILWRSDGTRTRDLLRGRDPFSLRSSTEKGLLTCCTTPTRARRRRSGDVR